MEHFTNLDAFLEPDPRSSSFVKIDTTNQEPVPMTIEDFHLWAECANRTRLYNDDLGG
jgi:hypothetical protein